MSSPPSTNVPALPQTFAPAQRTPPTVDKLPARFGRYELLRSLGRGGMGTVYLARDNALDRLVAIKFPNQVANEQTLCRVLDEARAAARVSHRHICSIYDVGVFSGIPYLTMEYVQGESLDKLISAKNPVSATLAVKIVIKIAAGLIAAHQQGLIHCDLKPANILMRNPSDPVITNFGLARSYDPNQPPTFDSRLIGSPGYMSPEQVRGDLKQIGPATDVYGLGTILYELLTRHRVHSGNAPEIYAKVLKEKPIVPSNRVNGIDPRLDAICMRALAKSPNERYPSGIDFCHALVEYLRSPTSASVSDDQMYELRPLETKSLAQSMYRLESRALHLSDPKRARPRPSSMFRRPMTILCGATAASAAILCFGLAFGNF